MCKFKALLIFHKVKISQVKEQLSWPPQSLPCGHFQPHRLAFLISELCIRRIIEYLLLSCLAPFAQGYFLRFVMFLLSACIL